jgi:hypothetical protein
MTPTEHDLVTLDTVQPDNEAMILPDFPATVDGRQVWVTAVLERTAIVEPAPGQPKELVNRRRCLVNPNDLRFGPLAARHAARRGREAARRNRLQQQQRQEHAA